jgi:hypothetical protein
MSLAWRVKGSVTFVAALEPGDGPRSPAEQRATGGARLGACGTVAEHKYLPPGEAVHGLDIPKKLVSWTGVNRCIAAETKTNGAVEMSARRCDDLCRFALRAPVERWHGKWWHEWGDEPRLAG